MEISFNPFYIKLQHWYKPVGIFLITIGLMIYAIGEYRNGYRKGIGDAYKITQDVIKDKCSKQC